MVRLAETNRAAKAREPSFAVRFITLLLVMSLRLLRWFQNLKQAFFIMTSDPSGRCEPKTAFRWSSAHPKSVSFGI
jgi:hypothetical protein